MRLPAFQAFRCLILPPRVDLFSATSIRAALTRLPEKAMDTLFLLTPGFTDSARDGEGKTYCCPDCAFLEGVLSCCPELRTQLDIRYIAYPRPRRDIVQLVGEAHQGCPNLVLEPANHRFVDEAKFHRFGDRLHSTETKEIVDYLAARYGAMVAHF